jgi:threonine aldolase
MTNPSIDLRSDTVTRPTPAMRAAMAAAEVGDDVYGEDPTVNLLEARAAEIFGRDAALFVPTGTMGNQIAVRMHTEHGQEVICESRGHLVDWEMSMVSAFSGCQLRTVYADRGILTWPLIRKMISAGLHFRSRTGLISLENTHNLAGGTVMPLEVTQEIWAGAADAGLPVHLDGARIFNAATALDTPVDRLTGGFASVMFCLSKGLCAPVGSMLVSSRAHIERARNFRKALGGGMRQAGILAAAGLIALNEMTGRLQQDHDHAQLLANALSKLPQVAIDPERVQTNIIIFSLRGDGEVKPLVSALARRGVLASTVGPRYLRLVTHHDVDLAACERASAILTEEITKLGAR